MANGFPSGRASFGSGLAQGLGQSLSQLPQVLLLMQEQQLAAEDQELAKETNKLKRQLLQLQIRQADAQEKLQERTGQVFERFLGAAAEGGGLGGLEEGGGGGAPDPGLAGFAEEQGISPTLFPESAAPAPAAGGLRGAMTGGGGAAGGVEFLPQFNIGPSGTSMGLRPQLPPDQQRNAARQIESLGVPPDSPLGQELVGKLMLGTSIGGDEGRILIDDVIQQAQAGAAVRRKQAPPSARPSLSQRAMERRVSEALSTAAGKAQIERATKPGIAAATAKAQTRAKLGAEREPVRALLGRLKSTLKGIDLPKTGAERMTAAPRLQGQSIMQTNENLVLFETLKEGFLAAVVRAAGERGTLTDQDIARARALMPNALPGRGVLPDTESIARRKLEQLEQLLGEFGEKDPVLAQELGQVIEQASPRRTRPARTADPQQVPGRPRIRSIVPVQ